MICETDQQWELKKAIAAKEGAEHVAAALAGLQGDLALVVKTLGVFTHVWDVVSSTCIREYSNLIFVAKG